MSTASELATSLLRDGIDVRLRLSGGSMKPTIESGSLVTFSSSHTPRLGDIALVTLPFGGLVAHRVVSIQGDWLSTKGDACLTADAPVPTRLVLGCATIVQSRSWIPLRSAPARALGLVVGFLYPRLAAFVRSRYPRKANSTC